MSEVDMMGINIIKIVMDQNWHEVRSMGTKIEESQLFDMVYDMVEESQLFDLVIEMVEESQLFRSSFETVCVSL